MLKKRIKKYSFWTGLTASLVVLMNVISKAFGFSIDNKLVEDIVMSICGVLMALGIVCRPTQKDLQKEDTKNIDEPKEKSTDIEQDNKTE